MKLPYWLPPLFPTVILQQIPPDVSNFLGLIQLAAARDPEQAVYIYNLWTVFQYFSL